ncbi:minor capsid protein [Limosilactobacillus mucosae]|uniref:minor capsid protein n=1 Tax=Limosilactobacillus mucosae TaxID=97478 RepID=UPI0022E349A1|nr:minor capsid protein [Limosilactobacillus mucosae]
MPSSYWEERAKQEEAWQLKQLENDAEFGKLLETYYNQAIDDISDSIEKELNRVGKDQVTQMDVKAYETKAKSIVAEAEKMRANGQKVTYADFSDQVNQRLKVYNATMRINRLEHLKSEVGLDMLRANIKVDSSLRDKLSGDYQKEVIRQAGIMMDSAQRSPWTGKDAAKILMAQTNGATFSQRLWADQDALKAKLDQVLSVGMIQGQNPRKMATRLREQVKTAVSNQRYVTERLARTESARIQNSVQLESIKKHGYNYVQWVAEPKACPACRAIASRDSGFGEGVYKVAKVPKIPDDTHPNCRCSISETWVEGKDDNLVGGKRSKALEKAIGVAITDKIIKKPRITRDVNVIQKRYDDAVSQYQEETGIDVIALMHEGNFVDTSKPYDDEKAHFIKWLMQQNGYNEIPKPVKKYSGKLVYRGVNDSDDKEASEYINDLKTKPFCISGADSSSAGRGIYVTEWKGDLKKYKNGIISEWAISDTANVLWLSDCKEIAKDMNNFTFSNRLMDTNADIIGILGGYDIIKKGTKYNVLNGGVLEWLNTK